MQRCGEEANARPSVFPLLRRKQGSTEADKTCFFFFTRVYVDTLIVRNPLHGGTTSRLHANYLVYFFLLLLTS